MRSFHIKRLDRASEASHDLNRLSDKPEGCETRWVERPSLKISYWRALALKPAGIDRHKDEAIIDAIAATRTDAVVT